MKAFVLTLVAALAAVPAATAKGPTAGSIDGPGTGGGISIGGNGEGSGSPLGDVTTYSGFFPAAFGQEPNPMLRARPRGDLGPRYVLTYALPGPNGGTDRIRMDVYPYARPHPVTYTRPGQRFFGDMRTRGGWYVSVAALRKRLADAGLPAVPPPAERSSAPPPAERSSATFPAWSAGLIALAVVLVVGLAATLALRRRPRGAPV